MGEDLGVRSRRLGTPLQKIFPRRLNTSQALFVAILMDAQFWCDLCDAKFDFQEKLSEHVRSHLRPLTPPQ